MGDGNPPDPQTQHRKTHRGAVVIIRIDGAPWRGAGTDGDPIILNYYISPQCP